MSLTHWPKFEPKFYPLNPTPKVNLFPMARANKGDKETLLNFNDKHMNSGIENHI